MTHSEIQDLLEAYVDDALDRPTRKLVETHLEDCAECRAILDGVAEVDLSGLTGGAVDERMLKRSVRKAMRRTVIDAVLAIGTAWLVIWMIGALLLQPLVVNRGGRAAQAARATVDTALMFNPGVTVTDIQIDSGWLSRTVTVELATQVGSGTDPKGNLSSRIGLVGFGDESGGDLFPFINEDASGTIDAAGLRRLGESTVATVHIQFLETMPMAEAQQLADSPTNDIRVTWAGFATSSLSLNEISGDSLGYGTIGYPTCGVELPDADFFGASSASSSGTGFYSPASIEVARQGVVAALDNLSVSAVVGNMGSRSAGDDEQIRQAIAFLTQGDPGVRSLVVTGPSVELAAFLDLIDQESAGLLAVDFYNWSSPICGR